jgi:hypothetical protein
MDDVVFRLIVPAKVWLAAPVGFERSGEHGEFAPGARDFCTFDRAPAHPEDEAGQNRDDPDNNQQLEQREACTVWIGSWGSR